MKVPKARKLKSGTWFIQLRLGGESIPVKAKTEKAVILEAQHIKAEYLAGKRAPKKEENTPGLLPTLGDAIDLYLSSKRNILSPSTIRGYNTIRKNRFQNQMDISLSDLKDHDWITACNEEATLCSAKTLTNAWNFIKTVIRFATEKEPPNVKLPQIAPNERLFLEPEQIKIFIDAVKDSPVEIPALLALSSLRRSEICALRWENIDLKKKCIYVKGSAVFDENQKLVQKKTNKNRSSTRIVPIMINELYDVLEKHKQTSGLIINCNPNTIWARINAVCKRADLPPVGIHGLRHSFASLAYHLGVPEKITMEMGGWADNQTMRKIYTHIAASDMSKYETKMADFFKTPDKNAN